MPLNTGERRPPSSAGLVALTILNLVVSTGNLALLVFLLVWFAEKLGPIESAIGNITRLLPAVTQVAADSAVVQRLGAQFAAVNTTAMASNLALFPAMAAAVQGLGACCH